MIKNFYDFINEVLVIGNSDSNTDKYPEELFIFHLSRKFINTFESFPSKYKIAKFLCDLKDGVRGKYLSKDPIDYLDLDAENNLTFLKSRYFNEGSPWTSTRREKMKITRALKLIYNVEFLRENIKDTDVEAFVNRLSSGGGNIEILEWRGEELLRAYNYKNECAKNFGPTCANFHQADNKFGNYSEPKVSDFDIYVKNPENCGVVVAMEDGDIMARMSFQQGFNVINSGIYTTDKFSTISGNYYGVGGNSSKYSILIKEYLEKKYNATDKSKHPGFYIKMETRFSNYCPFDSMQVCFSKNILSNTGYPTEKDIINFNKIGIEYLSFYNTYKARCPIELVNMRLKEENGMDKKIESFKDF